MTKTTVTNLAAATPFIYKSADINRDEAFTADGQLKPHWQPFLNSLEQIGAQEFHQKHIKSMRLLRDDGATYNIYNDFQAPSNNWSLDLIPYLINSEEWGNIEAGLLERAELFNLLLQDLYGPRELIRKGVIPPQALFGHPGFLRACDGIRVPGDQQLIHYAVDMVKDENGDICILTDRTQAPSGAGYALENRTVMSRVFPSLYRESQVHRLASYFQRLRSKLTALSPNQEQARIVVLTPGAHNETYFEHAFIANYLGFHLVQNSDLVVRNGFVWMKSLDGLNRVDVILRRVDDGYCDPVELRGDSLLGVPGLLEVVRRGSVVVANPLGSGILENNIFLRYIDDIAKVLLGRPMRLQSVPTYWYGHPKDRAYINANFDTLVIKPAARKAKSESVYCAQLSAQQKTELLAKMARQPERYVAQPIINANQLPTYSEAGIHSRPAILRSFVSASENSYNVMPGGLTRVGGQQNSFLIGNQFGSTSKDTWVISSEPTVLEQTKVTSDSAKEADLISLPSRVVENLFWMGRYAERAESALRLLRTVLSMLDGEEWISDDVRQILLSTVSETTSTLPGFTEENKSLINSPYKELLSVLADKNRPGSISADLNSLLFSADQSKELVSSDTLRVINNIRDILAEMENAFVNNKMIATEDALDPLITSLMALSGLSHESLVRGIGWRFMEIGRRLERAIHTNNILTHMLSKKVPAQDEKVLISAALRCLENLISYRRRYSADISIEASLDLLMLDSSNPRALLFQLDALYEHLSVLPHAGKDSSNELSPEENLALKAQTFVRLTRLNEICQLEDGARPKLASELEKLNELLKSISNMITSKYFDHRDNAQQLVLTKWE